MTPFHIRWLGSVDYDEAWDLQQQLFVGSRDDLLLCEHRPVFTLGVRGRDEHLLPGAEQTDAIVRRVNRGGDVTFHGPGQLVAYPVMSVAGKRGGGMADTVAYVERVEQVVIDTLATFGLDGGRADGRPGVWLDVGGPRERKIAAVGVRLSRGRSMHGFALNVHPDLDWFSHIVPCGLPDVRVTSMAAEGCEATMREVVDVLAAHAAHVLAHGRPVDRQEVAWRAETHDLAPFSVGQGPGAPIVPERSGHQGAGEGPAVVEASPVAAATPVAISDRRSKRLADAGVAGGLEIGARKPDWMKVKLRTDPDYLRLKALSRSLELTTVCEEAGCPNIFDCWNEGTATFMLLGERCTRACGFCLVDTRKPGPVDQGEPQRVAEAVEHLGLSFAVLTMVARDDLEDGGASVVASTVQTIRNQVPGIGIEVLISDLKGSAEALATVCEAKPDILNHNVETVARLQRAVRPSASYGRSLSLLARAKQAGLTTKSGLIVGMGETFTEVVSTLGDLAAVGVDIVTIGQYLRPTTNHLAIQRWWTPEEFAQLKRVGEDDLGIAHVESSPLTRSSHHAGSAASTLLT